MKALKAALVAAVLVAVVAPSFAGVYVNDFTATKQTWLGRAYYLTNVNYSTRRFGRVGKGNGQDGMIVDFDRAAAATWVQSLYTAANAGTISNPSQLGNGAVTVTMFLTPYDSWEESGSIPPTVFGHYYTPGVRISKGADWTETTATYSWAGADATQKWHSASGTEIASIYLGFNMATNDIHANMIENASSEQWGAADTIGGGTDVYVYDTPRPWKLDQSVAWAALENADAVGFQMMHDYLNKPWTAPGVQDDCTGSVYGRLHGLTEYRPYLEVAVDTSRIPTGPIHTYLPADFNQDLKVSFADYLILESNFGKTLRDKFTGDANGDGKCSFADYLLLEAEFGHTTTPEPATIGLLVLGGIGLLRKRQ